MNLKIIKYLFLSYMGSFAQTGLLNDDFSTGNANNWVSNSSGATTTLVNGQLLVRPAKQTSGTHRGDIRKTGGVTFHAGNYPIVAIKMNKPPRCNMFFDSNLGSYNNVNNNHAVIHTDTGYVYYWDLSKGTLGSTTLPTNQATSLSSFQFKIADIVFSEAEKLANDTIYEIYWIKTFASEQDLRVAINKALKNTFAFNGTFIHPGLLHNSLDLIRIRDHVNNKTTRPYASYQKLIANNKASASYVMQGPFEYMTRDNSLIVNGIAGGSVKNRVESDVLAAYYNALQWNITGNEAHALKSLQILDAYADSCKGVVGVDAELNALYGFMLANAAELMAHTYSGWSAANIAKCKTMLANTFYPITQNFRPCAHGNWDLITMKCLMAIAVFTENKPIFNKAINYFYEGEGNGSIYNYVLSKHGQLQESNRDQPHTMLALGCMAEIAEMAYKQGIDLYGANNDAVSRGYEYTSQYNLGFDVPYQTSYDYCERNYKDYTPEAISTMGRGQFRAVFEIAYNHYTYRKQQSMPQTYEVLQVTGAEGAPFGADNPGYGSLLFYLANTLDHSLVVTDFEEKGSQASLNWIASETGIYLQNLELDSEIRVYDMYGKELLNTQNTENTFFLSILNQELILIKITTHQYVQTLKIIKK